MKGSWGPGCRPWLTSAEGVTARAEAFSHPSIEGLGLGWKVMFEGGKSNIAKRRLEPSLEGAGNKESQSTPFNNGSGRFGKGLKHIHEGRKLP